MRGLKGKAGIVTGGSTQIGYACGGLNPIRGKIRGINSFSRMKKPGITDNSGILLWRRRMDFRKGAFFKNE